MNNFDIFRFKPFINEALTAKGFKQPTEVQERLIPLIAKGKNIIGQSQTGTGKTHTFLLPLFEKINAEKEEVQVVITAPSRELAAQIYEAATQIAKFSTPEIRVSNFVGGTDKQRQLNRLHHQQPQVVVGTPGRILDMMNEQALKIHTAFAFVVDEAKAVISEDIENWLISTKGKDENQMIYQLLTIGHPYLAIVFANTKQHVDEIADYLKNQGLKVAKIHGDITPRERKRVMRQVQNLEYQYVVATDLAARGIDIEGVSHVINAEIPEDLDFFIQRVGRTGRNGLKGTAITLYSPNDEQAIDAIEKLGVSFEPKESKNGEIVKTYDRNRRAKREKSKDVLDPTLIGLVKKKKKKIKPGYKKKIDWAIAEKNKKERKIERRQQSRTARKNKKNSHK